MGEGADATLLNHEYSSSRARTAQEPELAEAVQLAGSVVVRGRVQCVHVTDGNRLSQAASALAIWLVLGAFYLRGRLVGAIVVHCTGPGIVAVVILTIRPEWEQYGGALTIVGAVGCSVGSLFSFPVSVLEMLWSAYSANRTETK